MWIAYQNEKDAFPIDFTPRLSPTETLVAPTVTVQRRTGPGRYEAAPAGFSATVDGAQVRVTKQAAGVGEQAPGLLRLHVTVGTSSGRTLVEDPWLYLKPAA